MKQEINRNELIDAYLKGELPEDETAKVEELIATDAAFAKEVDSVRELHEIIMDSSLINIKQELSSIHTTNVRNKWLKNISGYGTGFVIIGLVLFYFLKDKPGQKETNSFTQLDTANNIIQNNSQEIDTAETPNINKSNTTKPLALFVAKKEITNAGQENSIKVLTPNDSTAQTVIVSANPGVEQEKQTQLPITGTVPKPTDCSKVRIKVSTTTVESCNDKATGSITVIKETVKGGKMPYLFSLNKTGFSDSVTFHNLTSNIYSIYVKDANNCVVKAASVLVGRKECTLIYQQIFAPLKGEIWEIPVKDGGEGEIRIFSKNGSLVYSANVSPNDANVWNGEDMSRQVLPMGVYQFVIRYSDGEVFAGNVTIKK